MAKKKRAARRSTGAKKRGPGARGKRVLGTVSHIGQAFSHKLVGLFLLVAGLFLTAAFLTGGGAFLGEISLAAATYLAGMIGFVLPPLAALAGSFMLLGRLGRGRTLGAALVLLAGSTTLAATLPSELRFDPAAYPNRGGFLGSILYAATYQIGGSGRAGFASGL